MTEILTPEQTAVRLQVTPRTIYDWLRRGKLPGRKIGGRWRVSGAALEAHLAGSPASGRPTAGLAQEGEFDEEPLSHADLKAIKQGLDDLRHGRSLSLDTLKTRLRRAKR
ncbi:MAG: helix-turn-helix domain-containing protein [Candidatus Riflebacteria bacterium]|nr:helix-turn-helix domain-containing protein [Candidatus Riflebacteria bacterium]